MSQPAESRPVENPASAPSLDPVATTARLTAAMRAQESRRADRLFSDPLAAVLAGAEGMAMLARVDAGDTIPVRTRWFDDAMHAAVDGGVDQAGVDQVVVLAAGMDTRAWRLGLPATTSFFELDRPALLALKDQLLADTPGVAAPTVRRLAVGADLTAGWRDGLAAAGHDPDRPTCWLIEGLLQYLPAPEVDRLLDRVTAASAPGSHLLTDVVGAALLEALAGSPMLTAFARGGMPWVFATDDPASLLAPRGWVAVVEGFADVTARFGRSPMPGPDGYLVRATR